MTFRSQIEPSFVTSLPSPPHSFHRICLLFCPQGFFCIFAHSAHSMLIKPPYRRFKGVLSLGNLLYFCSLTSAIGDLQVFCLQGFFCIFAHSAHWGFIGVLYLISLSNLLYGILRCFVLRFSLNLYIWSVNSFIIKFFRDFYSKF